MKGKRTDMSQADCAIARSLEIIGDWWSLLIIRDAFRGHERFGEFHKSLGAAKNILSARLKKLVDAQILSIQADAESASSHRYVLTPKGESLHPILVALWQWGEEHCFESRELKFGMVDALKGRPLVKMQPTSQEGRALRHDEVRLVARNAAGRARESTGRRKRGGAGTR